MTQNQQDQADTLPSTHHRPSIVMLSNAAMAVERVRVSAQVRLTHLGKHGQDCLDTRFLLERVTDLEKWVDNKLATIVHTHPTAPWFTRVKGTGGEAIGKVIGHIENFGRWYDIGDPMIPAYVTRPPEMVEGVGNPGAKDKMMVWVAGIERFTTPSKLRHYAGMAPGQRRQAGHLLDFNAELRTLLWRLGGQFLKATNLYYTGIYLPYRTRLEERFQTEGIKIRPTPKGRYCHVCDVDVVVKEARFCPVCKTALSLKSEPPGVMWAGHLHQMCQHRMTQVFLDHLWVVWREALGLPVRMPYPVEFLGHSQVLNPWDFCDRPSPSPASNLDAAPVKG